LKITGTYTLNARPEIIWGMVMDPRILEKVTPGIKELEPNGEDSYKAISEVSVGPVKGTFTGNLAVKEKLPEESCLLVVDQNSKMGNVVAEIRMTFRAATKDETEVNYSGEAKLSGTLARMGQRIIGGVVSTLSKQFFKGIERELAARQ